MAEPNPIDLAAQALRQGDRQPATLLLLADIERTAGKLDQALPFANMRETPYYRDAVYEQFSTAEYARRYAALRDFGGVTQVKEVAAALIRVAKTRNITTMIVGAQQPEALQLMAELTL